MTAALVLACKEPASKAEPKKSTKPPEPPKPKEPPKPEKSAAPSEPAEPAAKPAAAPPTTTTLKLEVGDNLQYSTNRLEAQTGSTVNLTIVHTGKLPKDAMGHNFVLLKKGTNKDAFASAALAAPQSGYIPPAMKDAVIAHTKLVGGGESDTISFTAPAPGEYIYLCTFPGHYSLMNGKLVVS